MAHPSDARPCVGVGLPVPGSVHLHLSGFPTLYTDLQECLNQHSPQSSLWCCHHMCVCVCGKTLDSLDGKQARRTNSSSPLGELFDHGTYNTEREIFFLYLDSESNSPMLHCCANVNMDHISFLFHFWWSITVCDSAVCTVRDAFSLFFKCALILNARWSCLYCVVCDIYIYICMYVCMYVYVSVLCSESRVHDAIGMLRDLPGALGGNCALLLLPLGRVSDGLRGKEKKHKKWMKHHEIINILLLFL